MSVPSQTVTSYNDTNSDTTKTSFPILAANGGRFDGTISYTLSIGDIAYDYFVVDILGGTHDTGAGSIGNTGSLTLNYQISGSTQLVIEDDAVSYSTLNASGIGLLGGTHIVQGSGSLVLQSVRWTSGASGDLAYAFKISVQAPVNASATYTITLSNGTSTNGGGTTDIPANSSTTATVAVGGTTSGSLETTGDHDWYYVTLTAGVTYTITLSGAPSGAGTLSDPYLRLYNSSSQLVASNDDISSSNHNSSLQFTPTSSGTYYIDAGAFSDSGTGTYVIGLGGNTTPTSGWTHSPIVLSDFDWAHGWGGVNNPRILTDIDFHGQADYLAFGSDSTLMADGGNWIIGNQIGPGFANSRGIIHDFGTNEGYTADMQRGAAATGSGPAESVYGQGYAGIYWYGATSSAPVYETSAHFYGEFGSQQGWTTHNTFQIVKASTSDSYASILGFGNAGVVVGPQAFAPGASAAQSYVIPTAFGNDNGWDQQVHFRSFTDNKGGIIDLNKDGIADFVGMGSIGLVFAYGTEDASHHYGLQPMQLADLGGGPNLGTDQGWSNATTLRMVVHDAITGYDDVIAFGGPGVFVAMGQNPATHGGQPFGQLYLAFANMGTSQGWSNALTPRLVGDVNGDGTPDIVGFGADNTFVAIGSRDAQGNLHFALDNNKTIHDFGYNEGWDTTTVRQLAGVSGTDHDSLVLSGASGTHVWDL